MANPSGGQQQANYYRNFSVHFCKFMIFIVYYPFKPHLNRHPSRARCFNMFLRVLRFFTRFFPRRRRRLYVFGLLSDIHCVACSFSTDDLHPDSPIHMFVMYFCAHRGDDAFYDLCGAFDIPDDVRVKIEESNAYVLMSFTECIIVMVS